MKRESENEVLFEASCHRSVTQWAAVVFADLLPQSAVFTHTAHPELVLLDRLARHDAGGQLPLRPEKKKV